MNVLANSNTWFGRVFFSSLFAMVVMFALDCRYKMLPFNGILLLVYLIFVVLLAMWGTSVLIQRLLKTNKPFEYDFSTGRSKHVKKVFDYLDKLKNERGVASEAIEETIMRENQKNIDERIDEFVRDVEKRFVENWYREISDNQEFLVETRQLLDEVIRRFLQVVVMIDNKALMQGILMILLRHVKEFKKSLKRSQKSPGTIGIEDLYRYLHAASTSEETFESFINQLTTKVLTQFVSSELWTSLLWRSLVAILSRKLVTTALLYLSQPGLMNYMLVRLCCSEKTKIRLRLDQKAFVSLSDVDFRIRKTPAKPEFKKDLLKTGDRPDGSSTPKISPKRSSESKKSVSEVKKDVVEERDEKNKKLEEVKAGSRAVSEPVKIYESSSHKTWRNSSDLECVSLGEDLLALQEITDPDSQIRSLIERKPWKDNSDSIEEEKQILLDLLCFEEEESVSVSPSSNIQSAAQIFSNTMKLKPIGHVTGNAIQNMKEFQQNTVNSVVKPLSQATSNAKHKIGDLQDEAAGVMEGIFDFGMAGLRKGLRLTGLQDNLTELTKSKQEIKASVAKHDNKKSEKVRKLAKCSQAVCDDDKLEKSSSNESDESVWINPLIKYSPNYDGEILLEKSPAIEKAPLVEPKLGQEIPQIATELEVTPSPDLEYEDAPDLATTTAKLRSLLAQRTSESTLTTPAVSPMPFDERILTPSDPIAAAPDLSEVDGVMPSLYKFYNKTATGLQNTFNTIKTALPGNEKCDENKTDGARKWIFETDDGKDTLSRQIEKLLAERRDFCTIDPAYDYVELLDQTDGKLARTESQFDDELDDFDSQVPVTKTLLEIFCELISDTNTYLVQEPIVKSLLVLFGRPIEHHLDVQSEKMLRNIKKLIGKLPETSNQLPMAMKLAFMVECCFEILPDYIDDVLGRKTLEEAMKILVMSLQSQKINQDIFLQLFELFASHLIKASSLMSPTFSA